MDEVQVFDRDSISWVNASSFRLRLDIHCNPYDTGDEGCFAKVLRSFPAQVNLNPFSISYGNKGLAKNPGGKGVSVRKSPTGKGICGARSAEEPGLTLEKYICKDIEDLLRGRPDYRRRLKTLLGSNFSLFTRNIGTRVSINHIGVFLIVSGLQPHNGTVEEGILFQSLSNGKMHCAILSDRFDGRYRVFGEDRDNIPSTLNKRIFYERSVQFSC